MENIHSDNFREKVYLGKNRCAVLFTAPWCGFCRSMKIMMERIRGEFPTMEFFTVDIDEEPELKNAFSVAAVPTLVVFEQGSPLAKATGLLKKSELSALLGAKVLVK